MDDLPENRELKDVIVLVLLLPVDHEGDGKTKRHEIEPHGVPALAE